MPDSTDARVAVYIDFDNVVISRYDNVFGDSAWRKDNARAHAGDPEASDPIDLKLADAAVDIGAIIDYASSFGTVAFTRAYADWSVPANAAYKKQLVDRAVDLTQLFSTSGTKNGADIRLSIDAVDDLFRHADLTHVVVVAGDSDYISLAQRCKSLGRFVVGIGVTGSTSSALVAACDEFSDYDDLPDVVRTPAPRKQPAKKAAATKKEPAKKAGPGRVRPAGRRHGAARARAPDRAGEERGRVALQRWREEPDAAHELAVQGEVARLLLVPRLRGVARQGRGNPARRQRPAPGAAQELAVVTRRPDGGWEVTATHNTLLAG